MIRVSKQNQSYRGWTFVELLVAVALSAVMMGAAAIVLAAITANSKRLTTIVNVDIGSATKSAFYGQSGSTVQVYSAPNYGRSAQAANFRELLNEDAVGASFVHCLPRQLANQFHPEFLRFTAGDVGSTDDPPALDTPEAFRQFLMTVEPDSALTFTTAIRNIPDPSTLNTSIFIVSPSTDPGYLRVKAIYEIDYVKTTNPVGTYASARRYKNGVLTHYYDVFYPDGIGSLPIPSFVAFEHTSRKAVWEGVAIDRFKIAEKSPFYFLWLPDPAINPHAIPNAAITAPASSPRAAYERVGARSSVTLVLPMFPQL